MQTSFQSDKKRKYREIFFQVLSLMISLFFHLHYHRHFHSLNFSGIAFFFPSQSLFPSPFLCDYLLYIPTHYAKLSGQEDLGGEGGKIKRERRRSENSEAEKPPPFKREREGEREKAFMYEVP